MSNTMIENEQSLTTVSNKARETSTLTLNVAVFPPWREPNGHFSQYGAPCSTQHEVLGEQFSILILGRAVTSYIAPASSVYCCGPVRRPPWTQAQALQWSGADSSMQTYKLTCSNNGKLNLLRVSDWITVQLFCLCKIAQSLTQWIKRDISEGTTEATTCTDGGCALDGLVSYMGALQPQYYDLPACLDQKKGTHLLHNVMYIPSAIQASTHMTTHCTAPWVGESTAPPSPPTAGSVGKGQKVCPTRGESCSDMRWEGGSVANSQRLHNHGSTLQHPMSKHTCCLQVRWLENT